jgi:tetratricopeptide (TPR) repeat protein
LHIKTNKIQLAAVYFRNACLLEPTVDNWKRLAAAQEVLEAFEEAAECRRRIVELAPSDQESHNSLGVTHLELRQFREALKCFKEAVKINPRYAGAYKNMASAYR